MDFSRIIENRLRKLEGQLCEVRVDFQRRARQNDLSFSLKCLDGLLAGIDQIQQNINDLKSSFETNIHSSTESLNEEDSVKNTEMICNQAQEEQFANLKMKIRKRQFDIIHFEEKLAKLEPEAEHLSAESFKERHWLKQKIAEEQIYLQTDIQANAKRDETPPNEYKEQAALIQNLEEKLSILEKETKCNNKKFEMKLAKLQVICQSNKSLMAQHKKNAIEQIVDLKAMKEETSDIKLKLQSYVAKEEENEKLLDSFKAQLKERDDQIALLELGNILDSCKIQERDDLLKDLEDRVAKLNE
ncbi:protein MLP2 [Drosophila guanche]|uniref:protein MLP2 n=1 Tax=Drosophila guanche TaxID=7266 RepID=UPI001472250E|nr:protein MLP2 [Drosophila guanche]